MDLLGALNIGTSYLVHIIERLSFSQRFENLLFLIPLGREVVLFSEVCYCYEKSYIWDIVKCPDKLSPERGCPLPGHIITMGNPL